MPTFAEQAASNMARTGGVQAQLQMGRDKINMAQFAQEMQARQRAEDIAQQQAMQELGLRQQEMENQQAWRQQQSDLERQRMGIGQQQWGQEFGLKEAAAGRDAALFDWEQQQREREMAAMGGFAGMTGMEGVGGYWASPEAQYIDTLAVDEGTKGMMHQQAQGDWLATQRASGTGAGGSFKGMIYQQSLAQGKSPEEAMADVMNVSRAVPGVPGGMYAAGGGVEMRPGAAQAISDATTAEKEAVQQAEAKYAKQIEEAKRSGRGEVTEVEQMNKSADKAQSTLDSIKQNFQKLGDMGGIVDDRLGWQQNIARSARASDLGQYFGKKTGSQIQTIRNEINMAKPSLMLDLMQSSGASARALDSDNELRLWLTSVGDTQVSLQTNMAMLERIQKYLDLGRPQGGMPAAGAAAPASDYSGLSDADLLGRL